MPYIKQDRRELFNDSIHNISNKFKSESWEGDLNYCINTLVQNILNDYGTNYSNLNAAIGALECAKLEIYRRICSPYEDVKIQENGDTSYSHTTY